MSESKLKKVSKRTITKKMPSKMNFIGIRKKIITEKTEALSDLPDIQLLNNLFSSYASRLDEVYSLFKITNSLVDEKVGTNNKLKGDIIERFKKDENEERVIILVDDKNKAVFHNAFTENRVLSLYNKIIPNTIIVYLESDFETFISDILMHYLKKFPNKYDNDDTKFGYSELRDFKSIEDIGEYLLKKKIGDIFWKSRTDQLKEINKLLGVDLYLGQKTNELLMESSLRRNIIVHNAGKVNDIYLNECKKLKINTQYKKCDIVKVDSDYLESIIDSYFDYTSRLIYLIFIQIADSDYESAANFINSRVFSLLEKKKYAFAIELVDFCLNGKYAKKTPEEVRCYLLINKCIGLTGLGSISEVKSLVDAEDWSAKKPLLLLAKNILLQDWDKSEKAMLANARKGKDDSVEKLGKNEFKAWPLFDEFRKTKNFERGYFACFEEEYYPDV